MTERDIIQMHEKWAKIGALTICDGKDNWIQLIRVISGSDTSVPNMVLLA